MKFFHLSDLHIGKTLHHYSMKEDQEAVLSEIIGYAASVRPDAVVIAERSMTGRFRLQSQFRSLTGFSRSYQRSGRRFPY